MLVKELMEKLSKLDGEKTIGAWEITEITEIEIREDEWCSKQGYDYYL